MSSASPSIQGNRRFQHATLIALATMASIAAATAQTQSSGLVTTEIAGLHFFARVADGPNAPNWTARTNILKEAGFNPAQIQLIVKAATAFNASVVSLSAQASAIHTLLKTKELSAAAGVQQLQALDQQRDTLFTTAFNQLNVDLGGVGGSSQFEDFLNTVVKPTITLGN